MPSAFWKPGTVVTWREAWRGREYIRIPVRVVEDDGRGFAFYLCQGTRYFFPPGGWAFGEAHPWAERGGFSGHGILIWQRPGAAHSIWHFWDGDDRRFAGWYVNLQEPIRRDGVSFFTQDHELDIWIDSSGSWRWKDEQELEDWVPRGRFTTTEVGAIRAEGERVIAEWPFPTGWEKWRPNPDWPVPELPDGLRP